MPRFKRAVGKNGEEFRSGFEDDISQNLDAMGIDFEFEAHQLTYFKDVVNGHCKDCDSSNVMTKHTYTPDFFLPEYNFFIETKGRFTAPDRTKMLAVKKYNPKIDIRFIFDNDNKIRKNSKTRYSDWCLRHGFEYDFKEIPEEWIEDDE